MRRVRCWPTSEARTRLRCTRFEIEFGVNAHHGHVASYFHYLGNTLTGQLGVDAQGVPVLSEITSKLPWTLGLVGVTTVIAFLIGTLVGVLSAWRRGGRLDAVLPPGLFILSAVPVFFVGQLLIYVFAVKLNWLPALGQLHLWRHASVLIVVHRGCAQARAPSCDQSDRRDRGAVGLLDAQQHGHDDRRGLRERWGAPRALTRRRVMFDYAARNAILPT